MLRSVTTLAPRISPPSSRPVLVMRTLILEARAFVILVNIIFAASLLGLASKHAFSVSIWPANAILVGVVLRDPRLFRPSGWAGAFIGFVAADLIFGHRFSLSIDFALTNVFGTVCAAALLRRLDPCDLRLGRVHSVLRILVQLIPASLIAGLCGAVLVRTQFHGSALQAMMTWPASEMVNYLLVLPAVLTMRSPWRWSAKRAVSGRALRNAWPAAFLTLSFAAMAAFEGPGSIMFPLPALLLCAMAYPIRVTSVLTMIVGAGCLFLLGMGFLDIGQDMSVPKSVVSVRIAIAFLALVPLTISSAMAVRDELLAQLRLVADHDGLTGLLTRRAFEQRMRARLIAGRSTLILWLDIDHFKSINDRHGHLAGDAVLQAFAQTARSCCREGDLVGRMGGEEFALVIQAGGPEGAVAIAERLRKAFKAQTVMWNDIPVRATVSIGAVYLEDNSSNVDSLVGRLDEALYRAKRNGRDRIEWLHTADDAADLRMVAYG